MFEVEWEYKFLKFFNVFDQKRVAMRCPANNRFVLQIVKDLICFVDEVADGLVKFKYGMPHLQGNKNKENN